MTISFEFGAAVARRLKQALDSQRKEIRSEIETVIIFKRQENRANKLLITMVFDLVGESDH